MEIFPLIAQAPQTEDIRDIVVLAPEASIWPIVFWAVTGLLLVALIIGLIVFLIQRQKRIAHELAPETIALRSLTRLQADLQKMEPNAFGLEVSETLKNYLVAKFNDPIRYQTAEEFLSRFADSAILDTPLPTAIHENLRTFISASEEIKFSKSPDTASQTAPLLALATNIVHLIQTIDESSKKTKADSII